MRVQELQFANCKQGKVDIVDLLLFGFALIASSFQNVNIIGLYAAIPLLIIRCFSRGSKIIFNNKQVKIYVILIVWIFLTGFVGEDVVNSLAHFPPILASALISFCVYLLAQNKSNVKYLFLLYILFYVSLMIYLYTHDALVAALYEAKEDDRAGGVTMNANNFAYYLPFLTISIYYYFIEKKDVWITNTIIFVALAFFSFYMSLVTASRQVLTMQIPLIALLMLVRFFSAKLKSFVSIIIIIVVAFVSAPLVSNYYGNSMLAKRSITLAGIDPREYALRNAFEVGMDNIIIGVGVGNYSKHDIFGQFSHCSYAELFASTGLMGVLLFLLIFCSFLVRQLKLYMKYKSKERLLIIIAIGIFLFQNMFYVYYEAPWLMAFPFIIMGYSKTIKERTC